MCAQAVRIVELVGGRTNPLSQQAVARAVLAEAEADYSLAMRRSMLDYVLLDREERARLGIALVPAATLDRQGVREYGALRQDMPWHERVLESRAALEPAGAHPLFLTHPVAVALLALFETRSAPPARATAPPPFLL